MGWPKEGAEEMGLSDIQKDLISQDRGQYGDPCYQIEWAQYKDECRKSMGSQGYSLLATSVFQRYGISTVGAPSPNEWTCCCPMDIFNQDPLSVVRMSLDAKLIDKEYWEVYADETGKARFVQILEGSQLAGNTAHLPEIRYCSLSARPAPLADLVIVRSGDAPPYRKCGDWIQILPGLDGHGQRENIFDGSSLGVHYSWGQVATFEWGNAFGYYRPGVDMTCSFGIFNQHATLVYPEYDRKQDYNDGITDLWEMKGFETILTWLIDVDFGVTKEELRHYSINFTKSSEIPMELQYGSRNVTHTDFPPTCAFYDPNAEKDDCKPEDQSTDEGCGTATEAWNNSTKSEENIPPQPTYIVYEHMEPIKGFSEVSRWLGYGAQECAEGDNEADACYESSTGLMVNGTVLNSFEWHKGDTGYHWGEPIWKWVDLVDFGRQGELMTIDIPQDDVWIELPPLYSTFNKPDYGLRWKFPDATTLYTHIWDPRPQYGGNPDSPKWWENAIKNYFRSVISYRFAGYSGSSTCGYYKWPGTLYPMQEGLYLFKGSFFSKVQIQRPGIHIKGSGRDADELAKKIKMRVLPVYQVDVPSAIGACGKDYSGWVDAYADLTDAKYCTVEDDDTEMEKLQEAMTGVVLDYTLPFYMPEFDQTDTDKQKFVDVSQKCHEIACMLYNYLDDWTKIPEKYYTIICEPPSNQSEVPHLGDKVSVGGKTRCINTISYSYQDSASFLVNLEVGPAELFIGSAGLNLRKYQTETVQVVARIVSEQGGALYKVHVPGIGDIKAWNMTTFPWDVGDRVNVTIYNNPKTQ